MAGIGRKFDSLRLNRFENERLVLALAISIAAHLLAWGVYETGREFNLWQRLNMVHRVAKMIPPPQPAEEPLTFVTVDQPSAEAPKNAKYYSDKNSVAANPDTSRNADIPQINGRQTDVMQTEDSPRMQVAKTQPSPPQTQPSENSQQQQSPAIQPGDLTLVSKIENLLPNPQNNSQPPRPRTIKEALAQQNQTPGVPMMQDGGVRRHASVSSLDVKLTGFGDYDAALVEAITQRWYDLLDSQRFALDRTGKVVLQFRLNYDGTISDMKVAHNDVGDLLGYVCQEAINDPAPFAKWPADMRFKLGDSRDIQFTFYYY
jgi:hypothetical protein